MTRLHHVMSHIVHVAHVVHVLSYILFMSFNAREVAQSVSKSTVRLGALRAKALCESLNRCRLIRAGWMIRFGWIVLIK